MDFADVGGTKYSALTTSLLAQSELTVQQVEDALKNEEAHRLGAAAAASSSGSGIAAPASVSSVCTFCAKPGHTVECCFKYQDYSKRAKEEVKESSENSKRKKKNRPGKTNAAQEPTESAGAASVRPVASLSTLPDSWNADTGATTHMTPHREWFKSYGPSSVGIRVANGQVVFAAGVGTVEFTPVKDGRKLCPVLFSNVLHVPLLNQNLLSVLTLTCNHAFRVIINSNTMSFIKDNIPCFYASVGEDRVALLSGSTVVQSQVASPAQASDYELWHHHFCHLSHGRLKSLVEHQSVSDLKLPTVPPASIPICPAWMGSRPKTPSPRLPPAA